MARKLLIVGGAVLLLALASQAYADSQFELGISATPVIMAQADQAYAAQNTGVFDKVLPGFHIAYRTWKVFYFAWDSIVLPPELVMDMTGTVQAVVDDTGNTLYFFYPGPYRPGFLNMWDFGLKLLLGPVAGYTTIGVNSIYVYKQKELTQSFEHSFGANWRAGLGLKFGSLGVGADFTAIFPSFKGMIGTFGAIIHEGLSSPAARSIKWVPSLNFILYL